MPPPQPNYAPKGSAIGPTAPAWYKEDSIWVDLSNAGDGICPETGAGKNIQAAENYDRFASSLSFGPKTGLVFPDLWR